MAKFTLQDGETIAREEKVMWRKGKVQAFGGRLVLTNRRLVFAQTGIAGLGLIGLLFNKDGTVRVEVPLPELAAAERGSFGRAKQVLDVKTRDGQTHSFM